MDTRLMILEGGHYRCTATGWRGHGERSEVVKLYAPTAGRAWVAVAGHRSELHAGALYLIPPPTTNSTTERRPA